MSVPIQEAAEALLPLLSTGGDAALRQLAQGAGKTVAEAASRLVERIRRSLGSGKPGLGEVEGALRSGLDDGSLDEADVRILASVVSIGGDQVNVRGSVTIGGSVYSRNTFNFDRNPEK